MLHTLSRSPWQTDLAALLRMLAPGDDVLLIQDGVLAALSGSAPLELLRGAPISLSVLMDDVRARGLAAQISSDIRQVSYTDFVTLTVKHTSQMSW
ncbi:sulfurtransferase complex subunit TusB [Entomohabitans teleogrylli]|uniref:sulfurtransferase complex subunit TusB n=1 Tax=Entomohabitans teleogrylli TaxID=1384589 RepID=UPI00073D98BE|nr:sulfurtransferase complex subunit TusB [Entomohabitans teleogrylli]